MLKKEAVLIVMIAIFLLLIPFVFAQNYIKPGQIPTNVFYTEAVAALAEPAVVQIISHVELSAIVPIINFAQGKIIETQTKIPIKINDTLSGTGFIATPDGHIVTNAHNIMPAIEDELPFFVQNAMNILKIPIESQEIVGKYLEKRINLIIQHIKTDVLLPSTSKSGFVQIKLPAEIKKLGEAYPGKDVAIIKINYLNLPTVNLEHKRFAIGAPVIVIGYPGAANIGAAPNSPTVTAGIISAYKTADKGFSLVQIDAPISHGSSGGPAFDSRGRVVGVATLEAIEGGGFNWVIPTQTVLEFFDEIDVHPMRGKFDETYERALVLYWNEYYEDAITQFNKALDLYPLHLLANDFIYQSKILLEQQKLNQEPPISLKDALLIIASVLLILTIIFLFHNFADQHKIQKGKKAYF